jgi:hypothetical protein
VEGALVLLRVGSETFPQAPILPHPSRGSGSNCPTRWSQLSDKVVLIVRLSWKNQGIWNLQKKVQNLIFRWSYHSDLLYKSQSEILFLESGALPLSHILSIRRLGYLHTILNSDDKEIIKRIYKTQRENPVAGDWVLLIQEDIRKYKIDITEEKIAQMDGKSLKNMVKVKVRKQAFKELCEVQKWYIKVQDIKYFGLTEPQEYLKSTSFSNKKRYLLYNLRCRSVNGIKDNFHRLYNN